MTKAQLEIEAMTVFQTLKVFGAVDCDNDEAVRELPPLLKQLSEKAERVYCAIMEGV